MNTDNIVYKRLIFVVKILVTAAVMYFIFTKVNLNSLFLQLSKLHIITIVIVLLTTSVKIAIQYNNWGKYLSVNSDYEPRKYEVLKSYFIGMALHFLLPAGLGFFGKIYFVNNRKLATSFSVGIERIFVTWKNLFFGAFAAIFYFRNLNFIIKILIFSFVLFSPYIFYLFSYLTKKKSLKEYFENYRNIISRIIGMQIVFGFISLFQYFIVLKNYLDISFWKVMISVPLIHISHILPISFSGFGVREIFAIEVFSKFNISAEIAISTTLFVFFVNSVIPAIIGLILLFKSRHYILSK